jgi:hypothetical protein
MRDLNGLFDAFYTRFVLRDFFAKIIPGLLFLFAMAILLLPSDKRMLYLEKMPVWGWLVIYGFGWIVGFAIQALGEITRLIRYSPKVYDELKKGKAKLEWINDYEIRLEFEEVALKDNDKDKSKIQYHERMTIIKESCGNAYVALIGFMLLLVLSKTQIINACIVEGIPWFALGPLMFIALVLRYMHLEHVYRQYAVICTVLKRNNNTNTNVKPLRDSIDEHERATLPKKIQTFLFFWE